MSQLEDFQTSVRSISLKLSNVTTRNVKPTPDKLNSYSWFGSRAGTLVMPKRLNTSLGSSSKHITLAKPKSKPCTSAE